MKNKTIKKGVKDKKSKVYCKDCRFGRDDRYGDVKVFKKKDEACCQLEKTEPYTGVKTTLEIITVKSNEKGHCKHFREWKLEHVKHPSEETLKHFADKLKKEVDAIEVKNSFMWWQFWGSK